MFVKLIFLASCLCLTYGSEKLDVDALLSNGSSPEFIKNAIKQSYEENKEGLITSLAKGQHEHDRNVTLVGSQNIYGPNGELVEIRTIELHLPHIGKKRNISDDSDNDNDDIGTQHVISEVKNVFNMFRKLGMVVDAAKVKYNEYSEITNLANFDKDVLLYTWDEEKHFVNKTIEVNTSKTVENHIKKLEGKGVPVAVHKFDAKGQFLSEDSTIVPEYLVTVVNNDKEVELELLEVVQKGLATVFLKYQNNKEEIPEKLAEYLRLEKPDFDYMVFSNEPTGWYLTNKYSISMQVNHSIWERTENQNYCILVKEGKSGNLVREDIHYL